MTPTIPAPRSDPYRDWLGITSEDRPPNHYQLLGLIEFEDDCAKISAAFENQFRNVRRYQVGARTEEAVHLLQRLSLAYAELSDLHRKSEYDSTLPRRTAGHDVETLRDAGVTANDTARIEGLRPPKLPPREEPQVADREKEIADGEIVSEELTTGDAETIVELEAVSNALASDQNEKVVELEVVWEPIRISDSGDSTGSQSALSDRPGINLQVPTAKVARSTLAVETSAAVRITEAERTSSLPGSLKKSKASAARDADRVSAVERLQISVLALLATFIVVPVGLLLVFVAPVALVVIAAYNFVAWLTLCVWWFVKGGWRTWACSVISAIVHIDRVIGVALGEDNQILHNFVRVVILVIGLAAGLALLASGTTIFS